MCGRVAVLASPDGTSAFLRLDDLESFPPRDNVAPPQPILVVMAGLQRPPGSNLSDRMRFWRAEA